MTATKTAPQVRIGQRIKILHIADLPDYTNREGIVLYIDGIGQLHGTWGGCAVIPEYDEFVVLEGNK